MEGVVVDTNVFVAAGFNANSASARLLEGLREGRFRLIWDRPTRGETEVILRRIPRLDWSPAADLFRPEGEFKGPVDPGAFTAIADPDDRKCRSGEGAAGDQRPARIGAGRQDRHRDCHAARFSGTTAGTRASGRNAVTIPNRV